MKYGDITSAGIDTLEQALYRFLEEQGINITRDDNFHNTPARWLKAMCHFFQEYDPAKDLGVTFDDPGSSVRDTSAVATQGEQYAHGIVQQSKIPFQALCAHHLLPVIGKCSVAYIPQAGKVVGLSKLTRLVYGMSHKQPSLQEHVANDIADALINHLQPHGAMVAINATHGCMACRGVEGPHIETATTVVRGAFLKAEVRAEFYAMLNLES